MRPNLQDQSSLCLRPCRRDTHAINNVFLPDGDDIDVLRQVGDPNTFRSVAEEGDWHEFHSVTVRQGTDAQRAIIIVPESLTHQWMVELLRRFNLQVSVFDEEKCQETELSSGYDNPFEAAQLVLLPMEKLLLHAQTADQSKPGWWPFHWDLGRTEP